MKTYKFRAVKLLVFSNLLGTVLFSSNAFSNIFCPIEICLSLSGNNIHQVGECKVNALQAGTAIMAGVTKTTPTPTTSSKLYEYTGLGGIKMYCYRPF